MTEYTCDSFRFFNLFLVYFGGKGTQQENLTNSYSSLPHPMGRILSILDEIPILFSGFWTTEIRLGWGTAVGESRPCYSCWENPMGIQKGRSRPYDCGLNALLVERNVPSVVFTSVPPFCHLAPPSGASWQGSLVFPSFWGNYTLCGAIILSFFMVNPSTIWLY